MVFRSKPEGAKLTVVDAQGVTVAEGVTPFTAKLRKGKAYFAGQRFTLTFHKEGYCDTQREIECTVSGWYFGNLLFGGLIGLLVVDPHTGAMYTLPKEISANLIASAAAAGASDHAGVAADSDDADELAELRAINLQDLPPPLRQRLIRVP